MMDIGMKTIRRLKRGFLVGFMALIGATVFAQRVHNGHKLRHGHNSPFVTTVVTRPVVTTKVSSKLSKNERLNMALTYLRTHPRLSVSKYSNLTGLGKLKAKAELDAFAMSKKIPIRMVVKCKRKYYILD